MQRLELLEDYAGLCLGWIRLLLRYEAAPTSGLRHVAGSQRLSREHEIVDYRIGKRFCRRFGTDVELVWLCCCLAELLLAVVWALQNGEILRGSACLVCEPSVHSENLICEHFTRVDPRNVREAHFPRSRMSDREPSFLLVELSQYGPRELGPWSEVEHVVRLGFDGARECIHSQNLIGRIKVDKSTILQPACYRVSSPSLGLLLDCDKDVSARSCL
mmetsp:Transcript_5093/g.12277  ORF Transcript_5093/g.12277 Transcript_5093/m.12277 type:complete len:217 (+) Transcript_5093:1071-1721(+)